MKKLKLGDYLKFPSKEELRYYLDQRYTFKASYNSTHGILKDITYSYPYRFYHENGNDPLSGAWNDGTWIVTKCPTRISFKRLLQCN